MAFSLIPEILDSVDVIFILREELGVVNAEMLESRHIEYIIRSERIGVDDRIGHDLALQDRLQSAASNIRNDPRVDLSTAF